MTTSQRVRMMERFHRRRLGLKPHTFEYELCVSVVWGLGYGASVRTINRVVKVMRAKEGRQ